MSLVAPLFGTDKALFIQVDRTVPTASITIATGLSDEHVEALQNRDLDQDHIWRAALKLPTGQVFRVTDVIAPEQLRSGPLYEQIAVPAGLEYDLSATLENAPDFFTNVSIMRSTRDFSDGEISLLLTLTPHLQTALKIHRRIALGDAGRHEALLGFDRAMQPVLVLDQSGYTLYINRSATLSLANTDCMSLKFGRLMFSDVAVQSEYERTLRLVLSDHEGQLPGTARRIRVPRKKDQGPPYALTLLGVHRSADRALLPAGAACMVMIHDQTATRPLPLRRLAWLYELTPAELKICEAIYNESTVEHAAEALCLSRNTVRSHLKAIYTKLGISSQGQLMRLLANSLRMEDGAAEPGPT